MNVFKEIKVMRFLKRIKICVKIEIFYFFFGTVLKIILRFLVSNRLSKFR